MHDGIRQAGLTPPVARFERRAMGSPLRLTIVGVTDARARAGWATVSGAIEELEEVLSRFRPSADLAALNRRAGDPSCRTGSRGIAPRARALGLAAWWIAEDGAMEMTAAARARTAWVAGEA